jgi:hypothetical protein
MSAVWPTIRGAARYEDINWTTIGLTGPPGSDEARKLLAAHWEALQSAAQFTDIDWYATAAYGAPPESRVTQGSADTPAPDSGRRAARNSATPGPAPDNIAGLWIGAFQSYPSFVQMTLEIKKPATPGGTAEGTLRLEPFVGGGGVTGFTTVTVHYDSGSRTAVFALGPEANRIGLRAREFQGFLHVDADKIAGFMANAPRDASPFFVLSRPRAAEDDILDPIRDATARSGRANALNALNPLSRLGLPSRGYARDKLERWAQKFVDEYPDVDAYRTESGQAFLLARNLFSDEHFSAHFGDTFDAMSTRERNRVMTGIRNVPAPRANFPEERTAGVLRLVERGFMRMTGTYTASDVTLSIIAIRHLTGWRLESLAQLNTLAENAQSFRVAAAIDAAGERLASFWWPSDRAGFDATVRDNQERLARVPLRQAVDQLLANASGMGGALAISQAFSATNGASGELGVLAQWAPETWQSLQARMNATLDGLLIDELSTARSNLGLVAGQTAAAYR